MKWIGFSTASSSPAGLKTHSIDTSGDQPLPARICFIADAFRCRNIRPNRTSGARRSSIKMDVSLRNGIRERAFAYFSFFLIFHFLYVMASRAFAMFLRSIALKPSFSKLRGRDEYTDKRWVNISAKGIHGNIQLVLQSLGLNLVSAARTAMLVAWICLKIMHEE